jgi:DnaA-homolog protein
MNQLLLDIIPRPPLTFQNFAIAGNREAVDALQAAVDGGSRERFFYLWGESGSGKTHLLQACAHAAGGGYLKCDEALTDFDRVQHDRLIALDDVDRLSDSGQIALFHLYNAIRETDRTLVISGPAAPAAIALRPELSSRLAWGLVFAVRRLNDAEKLAALARHAKERGFDLREDVSRYLISHCNRDLPSLMDVVKRLDVHSLATQRPITVALLKQMLERT